MWLKKKPGWVEKLEEERDVLSDSLSELDGLGANHELALQRIEFINKILSEAGYERRRKGVSDDTKAVIASSLLQSVWYSFNSEILGKLFRTDPFHIKPRIKN